MRTFVELGYGNGVFAPGLNAAQGAAQPGAPPCGAGPRPRASRRCAPTAAPALKVGPAENITVALPDIETRQNIRAAEQATRELNAPYLTVMLEGRYTDAYLTAAGADAPRFTDADLKTISSPVDFVGINVYPPGAYVRASDDGARLCRAAAAGLLSAHEIGVAELRAPRRSTGRRGTLQKLWNVKEIYITENGTSSADKPAPTAASTTSTASCTCAST